MRRKEKLIKEVLELSALPGSEINWNKIYARLKAMDISSLHELDKKINLLEDDFFKKSLRSITVLQIGHKKMEYLNAEIIKVMARCPDDEIDAKINTLIRKYFFRQWMFKFLIIFLEEKGEEIKLKDSEAAIFLYRAANHAYCISQDNKNLRAT